MDKAEEFTLRQRLDELRKALKRKITQRREEEVASILERLSVKNKSSKE